MTTRSGRIRISSLEMTPPKTRNTTSPSRSPARVRKYSPPASLPSLRSHTRKSQDSSPTRLPSRRSLAQKYQDSSPARLPSLRSHTRKSQESSPTRLPSRRSLAQKYQDSSPARLPSRRSPARKSQDSTRARKSQNSSPARSPSRKSPARKPPNRNLVKSESSAKYPASKSPSKETNVDLSLKPSTKILLANNVRVQMEGIFPKVDFYHNILSRCSEYSVQDILKDQSAVVINNTHNGNDYSDISSLRNRKSVEEELPCRSSILREVVNATDTRHSSTKSNNESVSESLRTYSDDENSEKDIKKERSQSLMRKLATPMSLAQICSKWEFGGRIGSAILMIILPLTIFAILISCMKSCSINALVNVPDTFSAWFGLKAFLIIIGQYIIQAVIAFMPILGPNYELTEQPRKSLCFNAFFSSIFTVSLILLMDFYKIFEANYLLDEYLKLASISYIFAVLLAIILYWSSMKLRIDRLNLYGNLGYPFYDFFMGREIHPYIKKLNIKLWISRISNISTLVLAVLIFKQGIHVDLNNIYINNYKDIMDKIEMKPTILAYSIMQIIYILSYIIMEYKIVTTFYWHSEGVGYLSLVSSALYPYYFTTISKFLADTKNSMSTNALISASIIYVLGLYIMIISNNIKYKFRKNPLHHLLSLESIPTFHGKKLIVSHVWGVVRHPNYAGDMLIHVAFALPGILTGSVVAAAPALCTIMVLLHRARRDHNRCRRRYGAAWLCYCKKVPYIFIPKVI